MPDLLTVFINVSALIPVPEYVFFQVDKHLYKSLSILPKESAKCRMCKFKRKL